MKNPGMKILKIILSASMILFLLASCSWFRSSEREGELIRPVPIGGYEALSSRIFYPKPLRQQGMEGTVVVKAHVTSTGSVSETRIAESLHPELDRIAANAIQRTRFEPATRKGIPEAVWIAIPIKYALQDEERQGSPFSRFDMTLLPDAGFRSFSVSIRGELRVDQSLPQRLELLLPLNADRIHLRDGSGQSLESLRVSDENGEWLVFESRQRLFTLDFEYRPLPELGTYGFRYMFALNQALPEWGLSIISETRSLHFEQAANKAELLPDGRMLHEYRLDGLEAYEMRYLELGISE